MSNPPPPSLFPFTDRVRALSNASSFAEFIQPLKNKPGVTDAYLDSLCERFLASRKGDVETAAQRFVAFTSAVIDHDLSFALDTDIIAGLSLSFILLLAPSGRVNTDPNGRPVVHILPRNIDYSRVSVHQMKKTWFFVIMQIAFGCPAAQQLGVVVINNLKDVSRSAFNMEFQGFVAKAISGAMPIKVSSIFLVHQPRMFGFIWTLVSPFLSSKIRGRVKMLGGSPASIFGELPAGVVSAEIGGAMQVDAAACAVQLQQLQQQRDGHVHAHLF